MCIICIRISVLTDPAYQFELKAICTAIIFTDPEIVFPIKDAQFIKYLKSIFLIILPFLPSLSCYGMVLIFRNGHIFWEVENVVFETSETKDCGILKIIALRSFVVLCRLVGPPPVQTKLVKDYAF